MSNKIEGIESITDYVLKEKLQYINDMNQVGVLVKNSNQILLTTDKTIEWPIREISKFGFHVNRIEVRDEEEDLGIQAIEIFMER